MFNDGNGGTEIGLQATAPPAGNTAVMVMSNPTNGDYEIYDVGGNAIESAYTLAGEIAAGWSFLGLGTFQAGDSNDMLLRNGANFDAYYINNNAITSSALVGSVGTNWNFSGIGNFDGGSSLSELLLRNSASGAFELYHVQGGGVLAGSSVAAIGNNLQVSGFGYFSETGTEQMAMEQANVSPGSNAYWLYTYNPATNSYGSAGAFRDDRQQSECCGRCRHVGQRLKRADHGASQRDARHQCLLGVHVQPQQQHVRCDRQ